tara:strand:+ start:1741 stop:3981 length:2241 start_codon:yes stop_codon:yes gene_type:complete
MQEKRFGETLKQNLEVLQGNRGDKLDRAVTFRDLLDTGIVKLAAGITNFNGNASSVSVINELPNLIIPPAPTNLVASGAFQNIILSWDMQRYVGHSGFEVFRHTSDVIASATLIAQVSGFTGIYSDSVGSNADFYYWVRAVNQNGVTGPFNSSTGTRGQTAPDVNFLLSTLTGAITSSELASSLSTPIGQIPGINTSISTINGNITTINGNITALDNFTGFSSSYSGDSLLTRMGAVETTANGAATSAQLQSEQTTRANADTALASDITTLQSSVSTNAAAIQTEQTARANADSALSSDITSLTTTVNNNAAAISAETTARSNADSALASDITSLNTATSNNAAAISAETTARTNADSALATDITTLNTATSNNAAAISSETTARTNADSAIASDVSTLQTTVSGNSTSISTQATSINGLSAQYTVKIDNNGAISGYGLASNAVNGTIVSEFIVNADRFAIMNPSTTLTNASGSHNANVPFIVQSSATTINGVSVPAGVYITDAFVRNGSIVNAKIGNAAIDDAKISDLAVNKITGSFAQLETVLTGTLDADKITTNTLNVAGKAIQDSIGRVDGTAGNDVSMTSHSEISQTTFVRNAPHHIAEFDSTLGPGVSAGDVMGGSPLFNFNFTTFNFSNNRKFVITITLDPVGSSSSASETGFAFAMRATSSSSNFTSTSASDYVTTRGTSRGGSGALSVYTLSDIVTLSPNTQYYIWVFGNMDDVGTTSGTISRGIRDGQISVVGLNR